MVPVPDAPVAPDLSRRTFLATTGGTLAGAMACGLVSQATAGTAIPNGVGRCVLPHAVMLPARPAPQYHLPGLHPPGRYDTGPDRPRWAIATRPWRGHDMGRRPRLTDLYLSTAPWRALPQRP